MYAICIFIGILVAFIKVNVEYKHYAREKNEIIFHGIGAAIIAALCLTAYYFFDWPPAAVFLLSYWNFFEVFGNWVHDQELLYVGRNAMFDKLIRKHFHYKRAKLALHIITILSITLIIILS